MNAPAEQQNPSAADRKVSARDLWVAGGAGVFAACMVGMAYAAVPLYDWFCRTTGFGGTTQVAAAAPSQVSDRVVTVRFDANVGPGLPWSFAPVQTQVQARLGEVIQVEYVVTNRAARETLGMASYNVTPLNIGAYFHKINCFCFTDQRLKPGERREMTVVFYVDPAIAKDADGRDVDTITLSYSFFPQRETLRQLSESRPAATGGRI
jgi:cytochrome c oxidase assembly protein subunit 11